VLFFALPFYRLLGRLIDFRGRWCSVTGLFRSVDRRLQRLLRGQGRMDGGPTIYGTVNPGYTSNDTASLVFQFIYIQQWNLRFDVISGSDSESLVPESA
jgi:hypothetical protein